MSRQSPWKWRILGSEWLEIKGERCVGGPSNGWPFMLKPLFYSVVSEEFLKDRSFNYSFNLSVSMKIIKSFGKEVSSH